MMFATFLSNIINNKYKTVAITSEDYTTAKQLIQKLMLETTALELKTLYLTQSTTMVAHKAEIVKHARHASADTASVLAALHANSTFISADINSASKLRTAAESADIILNLSHLTLEAPRIAKNSIFSHFKLMNTNGRISGLRTNHEKMQNNDLIWFCSNCTQDSTDITKIKDRYGKFNNKLNLPSIMQQLTEDEIQSLRCIQDFTDISIFDLNTVLETTIDKLNLAQAQRNKKSAWSKF